MMQALPPDAPLHLSQEAKNEGLRNVAKRIAKRLEDKIEKVLEDEGFGAGFYNKPPHDELATFLQVTLPAERPYLEDREYYEKYKAGIYPPLLSPYWGALLGIPKAFKLRQRRFRELYKNQVLDKVRRQEVLA